MVHGMSSVGGGISDNGHGVGSINESVYSVVALEPADTSGGAGAGWSNGASNASNLTGDDDTYTPLLLMSDIVGIWVTGLCCLLGLAGNILSFIVMLRAHGHSPMFYVLRAVAISDAIFLLSVFILQTLVNVYSQITVLEWCFVYRGYIQFGIWPVMMMTQMSTVWLTVLVSMERYVAICYPLHSARICTISKVRKAVIFTFVTAVLYNIPRYFEYTVVYVSFEDNLTGIYNFEKTSLAHNLVYRFLYNGISYALVLFFIPLMLLIILNFKLVWALQLGKKRWRTLQFRQRKEQNLTIIPLCIVLVFFICGTPALVVNMIDSMDPYSMQNTWFVIFMVIANLLVVLNSACNFIIYCLLGKKFRLQLSTMCRCRCRPYHVVHLLAPTQFSEL